MLINQSIRITYTYIMLINQSIRITMTYLAIQSTANPSTPGRVCHATVRRSVPLIAIERIFLAPTSAK